MTIAKISDEEYQVECNNAEVQELKSSIYLKHKGVDHPIRAIVDSVSNEAMDYHMFFVMVGPKG